VSESAVSSAVAWSARTRLATGASFVLVTSSVKVRAAEAPFVSVAVTRRVMVPTSSFSGVPENVWVAASNESQAGSGLPLAKVAV
jgi:hypothetical protein